MSKGRRSCLSVLYAVSQGWPAENLNRIKNLGTDEGGAKQAYRLYLPLECCPTLAFQHKMLPSYLRAATHILPSEPTFVLAVLLLTILIFKFFLPPNMFPSYQCASRILLKLFCAIFGWFVFLTKTFLLRYIQLLEYVIPPAAPPLPPPEPKIRVLWC